MSKNVFHFLRDDLYESNEKKKKWWLALGGGIEQVFDCYSTFEFHLEKKNIIYKIEQICDKGFWHKFKALFKRQEPYYEIYIKEEQSPSGEKK